jgi:ATP-dependent helicase/DNAse subunit B
MPPGHVMGTPIRERVRFVEFRFYFACGTLENSMKIWTGPAGSGKTAAVLEEFRAALRARRDDVRLLVPTATLAEHLQNRLARAGFVFRRSLVQTLSGFVETVTRDLRQVSEPVLYLIVEEAARQVERPEFARVVTLPGFCATVARVIGELSSAGCDSSRLASCLPEAPLAAAFLAVYREVDRELERRGMVLRARRLEIAAERIDQNGLAGIATVWLDGFHALPDPELRVLRAIARHADVTVTIGEADLDERLRALADQVERRAKSRPSPVVAVVRAPNLERECDEIARRIVEQAAAGRPFREIGVVVRSADVYAPILHATLERFGIPARFYFDEELARHPEIRFLTAAVDAMLGGWDHAATLAAMRLAPKFEDSPDLDRFDWNVREKMPNRGLDALQELGAPEPLLARLAETEAWRSIAIMPREWADRIDAWARSRLLRDALDEAAVALEGRAALGLETFWRAVKAVIRLQPLRAPDQRRNVVNVISAHEARQWVLPVVYVCGMVEKQFPQFHRQDPFFSESARRALNASGVRVRTAEQFDREERALFDSAITRATLAVALTYPEFDGRGERNLPSIFLESVIAPRDQARPVRPEPRRQPAAARPVEIRDTRLLDHVRRRTAALSATRLEDFLQCPYRSFARQLLRLKPPPLRPDRRLDWNFLQQGEIVHTVLARWWQEGGDIGAVFEEEFAKVATAKNIQTSYQTERVRNAMLLDLRQFAADGEWDRTLYLESRIELDFQFPLTESVAIRGKIDRLDVTRDGRAVVIDYKYSNAQNLKARLESEDLLQAPLYLIAAERQFGLAPDAMYYLGVKAKVEYGKWATSEGWEAQTVEKTLRIVDEMRSGRIEIAPADPDKCRYCDARDICRVETGAAAALAEGA